MFPTRDLMMNNFQKTFDIVCPRYGEAHNPVSFRSSRLFSVGNMWYFSTREGSQQGPFLSRQVAEMAVKNYIKQFI